MRRKRFQKGSIRSRRHGSTRVWLAQWREEGVKKSKVLGPCSEIPKAQADAMLAQIVQPINLQVCRQVKPVFLFGQYVEEIFLPVSRRKWKESTRSTSEPDIKRYLVPPLGPKPLQSITRSVIQQFLDEKIGRASCRERV